MYKSPVEKHFDEIAGGYDFYKKKNSYYYDNLKRLLNNLIPLNKDVFEVGCGTGDLLESLKPKKGYGVDISPQMVDKARVKYKLRKNLMFSTVWPSKNFDYIFMSDVIEHLEKPFDVFKKISERMDARSLFVCTMANPLWEPLLMLWENICLKMPEGPHNRIKFYDIKKLVDESELKIVRHGYKLLIPVKIPLLSAFANRYLEKYLKPLSFIEYFIAVKV